MSPLDTSLPPALFDVDNAEPETKTTVAHDLHEGLDRVGTREQWRTVGYCVTGTYEHDEAGHPTRSHLCTKRLGHDGPHKCDRCDRTWRT